QRNMQTILSLISQKKITPEKLVTHTFQFSDVLQAYELLTGKKDEPYLGIVLEYPDSEKQQSSIELKKIQKENKIELALIGAGNFSQSVALPALSKQDVGFNTIVDYDTSIGNHIGKKFGFSKVSSSLQDVLNNKDINTVMITTPHNTHAKLVTECLKAKKNVFVEKPLAMNEQELEDIKKEYENSNKLILVGFNRRFSTHAKKIREFMKEAGTPMVMNYIINAGAIPPEHWTQNLEVGGGRIIGEVCHFVDFMQYISGSNPTHVYAVSIDTDNILYKNDDSVQFTLKFKDGSVGCITYHAVGDRSLPKEYFEVSAGTKTAKMYNFYRTELYHDGKKSKFASKGQDKGFIKEYTQFFDAIKKGKESPVSFSEIYASTLATIRAVESIKTGLALGI
nr:Gfo/Idh/MocA family oxidoreductase [Candidatus Cloacimonadota bacterium]